MKSQIVLMLCFAICISAISKDLFNLRTFEKDLEIKDGVVNCYYCEGEGLTLDKANCFQGSCTSQSCYNGTIRESISKKYIIQKGCAPVTVTTDECFHMGKSGRGCLCKENNCN